MNKLKNFLDFVAALVMVARGFTAMASAEISLRAIYTEKEKNATIYGWK
jgi:hypothetical protein